MSKLLLLEDDMSLVDGLSYSLKKDGYDIEVARTVGAALERLAIPEQFDLLRGAQKGWRKGRGQQKTKE